MAMRVTSADFIRNFGSYSDSALGEPIIITKNGRERLVLLSVEEYNALRLQAEGGQEAEERAASRGRSGSAGRRKAEAKPAKAVRQRKAR